MFIKAVIGKLIGILFGKEFSDNILYYITGSEALPLPLTPEEETAALDRLSRHDDAIKETLIERNLRLVVYIARKFDNTGVDTEDLVSVGTIGLIKAINSFDTEKKIKLATYASRCIENEILMYLRRVVRLKYEVSLDEPLNVDWEGNELLMSDILGTEPDTVSKNLESSVERQLLWNAIEKLQNREKEIMRLRFGLAGAEEKTQKEVADLLGISQSYISRLEKRIMQRLRRDLLRQVS